MKYVPSHRDICRGNMSTTYLCYPDKAPSLSGRRRPQTVTDDTARTKRGAGPAHVLRPQDNPGTCPRPISPLGSSPPATDTQQGAGWMTIGLCARPHSPLQTTDILHSKEHKRWTAIYCLRDTRQTWLPYTNCSFCPPFIHLQGTPFANIYYFLDAINNVKKISRGNPKRQ